ncbi:glutamate-5-semialdehyde dehydrogenase [Prochlorococcus sp. MIT 1341]|uniref:glutamate-5-semialdehyde dehydrogenase n=1 Tax=Prochlorococcus sp. MIT 1341 TaxID=3096221 RepID=UPI002A757576|nr:glutamate-5-semialdehyde dehydrogenase [Prochlorococcus sp. MIT 1341]
MTKSLQVPEPSNDLLELAAGVRRSAMSLGQKDDNQRKSAIEAMAASLEVNKSKIVVANEKDLKTAKQDGLADALIARLKLDEVKLKGAIAGMLQVADLPDPLGIRQVHRELDENLVLDRVTVPLGVLGVIFEARPDAVIQIASLAIRSGNGALLKGGSEALLTNEAIMKALKEGLHSSEVESDSLALLTTRKESLSMLKLDGFLDLIIPRGSNQLVQFIQDNTRIPVLGHADGICHLYIDSEADLQKALRISIDSKTQYPAACNAIETLLVHHDIAEQFLTLAIPIFNKLGVRLLGDLSSQKLGVQELADESDWSKEYLDLILSIKIVSNIDEAIDHIHRFGSRHTEAIVTSNEQNAEFFLRAVDSSGVYHNCSTRFADGFRYGFGAEVGISTQTLPPRGPVGLEGLVTYRYRLRGDGHIAEEFNSGEKSFSHIDLPL